MLMFTTMLPLAVTFVSVTSVHIDSMNRGAADWYGSCVAQLIVHYTENAVTAKGGNGVKRSRDTGDDP